MKVLLVEDNQEQSGHQTDTAENGKLGLICALQSDYDVIICDRMMPEMDGLQMIQALRASGRSTPILVLSALDSVEDRVKGLRNGGDDYLVKPFAYTELLARIEILSRRQNGVLEHQDHQLYLDTLKLDPLSRKAHRSNIEIILNNREYQILKYFMDNIGRVITRTIRGAGYVLEIRK